MTAAAGTRVPDDVWAAVPTRRLPRGRVIAALLAVLLLVWAAVAVMRSGWVVPRLVDGGSSGSSYEQGSGRFVFQMAVVNDGDTDTTLGTVTLSSPWLTLVSADYTDDPGYLDGDRRGGTPSVTLQPGESTNLTVTVTVDCDRVDDKGTVLQVQATTPWRTTTVELAPTGTQSPDAPPSYSFSGPDPYTVPWPVALATGSCTPMDADAVSAP